MPENDRTYDRHRAEVELARAQRASLPTVIAAHQKLATAYMERVDAAQSKSPTGHA